jgi:multisubunit Na+/H+ antiporter MnhB subunit
MMEQGLAMISTLAVDAALALLVLGLAVWVTVARAAYGAVVGFVAYGLLLAIVWVRLAAVDVAMTEAALGTGLTGLLLLGAAARLAPFEAAERARRPALWLRVLIGLLCAALAAALAAVVLTLPEPGPTLAPLVAENLTPTGMLNPVTGVLLAHRAIDTLLESVVLVLALIGVWSLATDSAWGGQPGFLPRPRPGPALTLLAQLLPPFGILVGIHLVWNGADHPGGKFQGATVLAAMWVLIMMAGLREPPTLSNRPVRVLVVIGTLTFIGIGVAGVWLADVFLGYPEGYAKPLILIIEAVLTLSVAVILGLLLAGPPAAKQRAGMRS